MCPIDFEALGKELAPADTGVGVSRMGYYPVGWEGVNLPGGGYYHASERGELQIDGGGVYGPVGSRVWLPCFLYGGSSQTCGDGTLE